MNVISLKDYAAQNNISYEAIRQQVVRYKDELAGHLIRDGRQQFLDEEAVAFLDSKRQKNPVAIIQQNKDEQIEALEEQVKQLLVKTAAQADRISELAEWKADSALLLAGAEQSRLALEASEKEMRIMEGFVRDAKENIEIKTQEAIEARQEAREARQEASEARREAEDLRERLEAAEARVRALKERSWWQRLRRKGEQM